MHVYKNVCISLYMYVGVHFACMQAYVCTSGE